jgi:pyocin large subunit-like protein
VAYTAWRTKVRGAASAGCSATAPTTSCCGGDASGACAWQSTVNLPNERNSGGMFRWLLAGRRVNFVDQGVKRYVM